VLASLIALTLKETLGPVQCEFRPMPVFLTTSKSVVS
jgi:hypothetical protein